jgi:hypothetical protein
METRNILAILVVALGLVVSGAPIVQGAEYLRVNGQEVDSITLKVGQSCIVEVVSDDSNSYRDYVGFDNGLVLGFFSHLMTYPNAGDVATVADHNTPAFSGYYIVAYGESPPPSPGVHFVFEYGTEQPGETDLTLYKDAVTPTSVIDSIHITVIPVSIGTTFTYQGRLMDSNSPAGGLYDFRFKLYDNPAPLFAVQQGGTVDINDLDVMDGYFTVVLDFNEPNAFTGDSRWLEVGVRPGDSNDPNAFVILSPRQEVTPAPYALFALNSGGGGDGHSLDAADGDPVDAVYVDNEGNVGMGTTSPLEKLDVDGSLRVQRTGGEYGIKITREGPTDQTISSGLYVEHEGHNGQSGKYAHGVQTRVIEENSGAVSFSGTSQSTNSDAYGIVLDVTSGGGTYCRGIQVVTHDTNPSGGGPAGIVSKTDSVSGTATGADISADVGTSSTSAVYGTISSALHQGAEGDSYGLFTTAAGSIAGDSYGLYSDSAKWNTHTNGTTYGAYLTGRNYRPNGDSYGLYTQGSSSGGTSYGIYALASGGATNWAVYSAGNVFIGGQLQVIANPFRIDGGNVLLRGADDFNSAEEQAILYLGDTNHSIRSEYAFGLKLGTLGEPNAIIVREATGNVGIGTSIPSEKLEIKGGGIKLTDEWSNIYGRNLKIWGDAGSNLLLQSAGGNVGIGTTSPTEKLEVAGTVKGVNNSGTGVFGESTSGTGVGGSTYDGVAVFGRDGSGSGLGYAGYFEGNVYVSANCSAMSFTDRTPYPKDLHTAYQAVMAMERLPDGQYDENNKQMQLDHSKLSDFIKSKDGNRDLSATVSAHNEVLKDLIRKNDELEEAHVHIDQLHERIKTLEAKLVRLEAVLGVVQ